MLMIPRPCVWRLVLRMWIHGVRIQPGNAKIIVPLDSSTMIQEYVLTFVLQVWMEMDHFPIKECVTLFV